MKVLRLDHLVFAVQELEQAADAWARAFGLRAEPPYRPEGSHLELARLPLAEPDGHGAFLELAAVRGEPALSRAQPALERSEGPAEGVARHMDERGEGMFSVSIEVDDLNAAVRELRAKGVTVSDPEAGVWPGSRLARIRRSSAFGVAIQLIERGPAS